MLFRSAEVEKAAGTAGTAGEEDGDEADEGRHLGFHFDFDVGVAVGPEKQARWKAWIYGGYSTSQSWRKRE